MKLDEEYRLSLYEDLGELKDGHKDIRLKRHKINGRICVEKRVPATLLPIYSFLEKNPTDYIPHIYECVEDGKELIIEEEYIDGKNLEEILAGNNISEKEAVMIILDLCSALAPLHNASPSIICRDLKPENIMINNAGHIKIVDFNIARTYQEGKKKDTVLMGTVDYAAPEQYGFFQTDNRTDIYALGVLFNYMLIKKYPVEEIAQGKAEIIIRKCIQVDKESRFQNVEDLYAELAKKYPECRKQDREKKSDSRIGKAFSAKGVALPGFRTGNPLHMILAAVGYIIIICFSFSLELTRDGIPVSAAALRIEQTCIMLSQIALVFLVCNYLGCRDKIAVVNDKRKWVRIIGYIIGEFVLLSAAVAVSISIEMAFL